MSPATRTFAGALRWPRTGLRVAAAVSLIVFA